MQHSIHDRLKMLIEGTHEAFESYGAVNIDYAGFAALSLSEFKDALKKPELTGHELRKILRKAHNVHNNKNPQVCWATFMAQYIRARAHKDNLSALHHSLKEIYKENSCSH